MTVTTICIALALVTGAPDKPSPLLWSAGASLGVEYDSNATRLDSDTTGGDPVHAALLRGQAHLAAQYKPLPDLVLAGSYDLAGKVFFMEEARGQDTLIHRLTAAVGLRLDEGIALRVGGLYHEGFQRAPEAGTEVGAGLFDFRLLDGRLMLALAPTRGVMATVGLGGRRFVYKPEDTLSFDALVAAISLDFHTTVGKGKRESELDVSLSHTVSRRRFVGEAEQLCPSHVPGCELISDPEPGQTVTFPYPGSHRRDVLHRLSLQITWVRTVLLSAGYEYGHSASSSFGFGYQRHEVRAKLVTPLFWEIYATLQLRARLMYYETNTVVLDDPGFEEENRSHALLQLERSLYKGLRLVLRYTFFVGDLRQPDVANLRHLVFLGCAYRYGNR